MAAKKIPVKPFLGVHVPFDKETWAQVTQLADKEDRTNAATVRVLVREAMAARSKAVRP